MGHSLHNHGSVYQRLHKPAKNFVSQNVCLQKVLLAKFFVSENFCPQKFFVSENFWSEKIFVQQKLKTTLRTKLRTTLRQH